MKNQKAIEIAELPKMVDKLSASFVKHILAQQKNGRFIFQAKQLPSSSLELSSPLLGEKADSRFIRDVIRGLKSNGFNTVYVAPSTQCQHIFEVYLRNN